METLKTKPDEAKAQQELGDETFMSAADLRSYMTEMQMAKAMKSVDGMDRAEKARQDLENARRTVALQTRQAYLGVTSGLGQVKALEQAVASTQLQLESTKLGQEVGVRTAVDVLDADQQLAAARRDFANAIYNTVLSQLRLKAAVGKLTEADLADINKLLREN